MTEADRIYDELAHTLAVWGLAEIPFSESASSLSRSQLRDVFTGRTQELREVLALFQGRERKRLLVYGWVGIGKTAFILEVLGVVRRKAKDTLATYISLPPGTDLATAALIALAREMEDDEWAQQEERIRNAKGIEDVELPVSWPRPMEYAELIPLVTQALWAKWQKYRSGCSSLDTLVYVDLEHTHLAPNSVLSDVEDLKAQGWRSVSMFFIPYAAVLVATPPAADFLLERVGQTLKAWPHPEGWFEP